MIGKHTAYTAIYPYLLCRRFARVLMESLHTMFGVFQQCENQTAFQSFDFGMSAADEQEEEPLEEVLPEANEEGDAEQVEDRPDAEVVELDDQDRSAELKRKLKVVHRNLGHPCNATLVRLLTDAGANDEVLAEAKRFECADCLQRGRRASSQTAVPQPVREKWHTISVDTFWWKYPETALHDGETNQHVVGISIMDEATDLHSAVIVRKGFGKHMHNISGEEFIKGFSEGWLQRFPAPTVLRYDEEGFFRNLEVKEFLENFGMKLEPIAGESAWQLGKHSRHLQTLKEQCNLIASELGTRFGPHQILSLAISAKNSLHNIRGYSPNQWAFGQGHGRISSFLQQYDNLPLQSRRQMPEFEETLQAEALAQKTFLEADARRRLARALRFRCRPLKEFQTGQLVYYFRKGQKEGSRYGGKWFGPARVLCHEKTTNEDGREHVGSIVWVSHAGVLLRCSPEQLRPVTRDLSSIDREINGPRNFHTLLEAVSQQQKFVDVTDKFDIESMEPDRLEDEQDTARCRLHTKRPPGDLFLPEPQEDSVERYPHGGPEDPLPDGRIPKQRRVTAEGRDDGFERAGSEDRRLRQEVLEEDLPDSLPGQKLREVVHHRPRGSRQEHTRDEGVYDLPPSNAGEGGSLPSSATEQEVRGVRKRKSSKGTSQLHEEQDQDGEREPRGPGISFRRPPDGEEGISQARERDLRVGPCPDRREPSPGRDHGGRDDEPPTPHEPSGRDAERDCVLHAGTADRTPQPVKCLKAAASMLQSRTVLDFSEVVGQPDQISFSHATASSCVKTEELFSMYVNQTHVVEIEFVIAPRDVHCKKGIWVLNQKVKKHAEVVYRQLSKEDQVEFDRAMKKEIDSYISSEAVAICEAYGIPRERIMQMRWVHTWKVDHDEHGKDSSRRAKARLIVKGFQDPRLLHLPRESPTLSSMGRNLLLSAAARNRTKLCSGDIKTAFLQGRHSELNENIYGEPPPEVRKVLQMTPTQVLRISKAIYGLLNAPKQWFESICSFLKEQGWIQHQLDQCLFKLPGSQDEVLGYIGLHVDDVLTTGQGPVYKRALQDLKTKFTLALGKTPNRAPSFTVVVKYSKRMISRLQ